jgi:hypothetical protein
MPAMMRERRSVCGSGALGHEQELGVPAEVVHIVAGPELGPANDLA